MDKSEDFRPAGAEVLARLHVSRPRLGVAVFLLIALGFLLCWVAFSLPLAPVARLVFGGIGVGVLWISGRQLQSGQRAILLTAGGLTDDTGRVIAPLDKIGSVDRGAFAFKPSNGFLVRLSAPMDRAWVPGLWWRLGRRIGVGGVTPAAEGRVMAEALQKLLDERFGDGAGS